MDVTTQRKTEFEYQLLKAKSKIHFSIFHHHRHSLTTLVINFQLYCTRGVIETDFPLIVLNILFYLNIVLCLGRVCVCMSVGVLSLVFVAGVDMLWLVNNETISDKC